MTEKNAFHLRPARLDELDWVNSRYAEIGFQPSSADDFVVIAETAEGRAGLGRLVRIDETQSELGGIYVFPEFRGKHLAQAIVAYLLEHSPHARLFCIPFAHLSGFYQGFGFVHPTASDEVPTAILRKVDWCRCSYPEAVDLLLRTSN